MSCLLRTLQLGPMPRHVGFIMDGNRRFAKQKALQTFKGHELGFSQLENVCFHSSLKESRLVLVY